MKERIQFVLKTREEAEDVLKMMRAIIDHHKMVSVGELYDLVGLPASFEDEEHGWTDLSNAFALSVQDGYVLNLPDAVKLT